MTNPLRQLIEYAGVEDADICLYGTADKGAEKQPLFFYHMHKTGGMSVTNCLRIGYLNWARLIGIDGIEDRLIRFDTRDVMTRRPPPVVEGGYLFVSSHNGFGHHEMFNQDFKLLTMLRDPVGRVIADFHFWVWRHMAPYDRLDEETFQAFIHDSRNRNLQCQHLSPRDIREAGDEAVFDDALANLSDLDGYGTADDWEAFMQSVWTSEGFPSLASTRWLKNRSEERLEVSGFLEEITDLNRFDIQLFEFAKANPKPMAPPPEDNTFSTNIIVAADHGKEDHMSGDAVVMPLADFMARVQAGEKDLKSLSVPR